MITAWLVVALLFALSISFGGGDFKTQDEEVYFLIRCVLWPLTLAIALGIGLRAMYDAKKNEP